MKRSELFFSFIQVPVDFIAIILAAMTAFAIRHVPQVLTKLPKLYTFEFSEYIQIVLMVAPLFLIIYALEGLYNIRATRKYWQEALKVFKATSIGLVIIIVAIFLKREWFSSRFIILSSWVFIVLYVSLARYFFQALQKWLLVKKGVGVHRVLLINGNKRTKTINKLLKQNKSLGYRVVETITDVKLRVIKDIKKKKGIDEIILCDPTIPDDQQEKLVDYCSIHNIAYSYIPTSLQTPHYRLRVLNGEPLFEVMHTPLDGWGKILKRLFDIISSIALIILSSPIMIVTAILIRLEDKGPIIYKNERIGADGEKFFLYKFRYMKWEYSINKANPNWKKALQFEKDLIKQQSVRKGPLYKIKDDPRKTRVGKIIEKLSIDELPQFFNVLKGEMSLVGPRPHQEREVNKYREYHRRLLTIKPGITGMAQVSGRSDLDFEDEYKLDVVYIEDWSLWLDVVICLKTAGVLFRKRKN